MKKANKSKKFLSLLIALVLLLGLMPIASITARAEEIIIDKIEITGVTAPVAGEKPTYDGITLKTAEAEILGKSWLVFTGKDDFVHSASKPFESGQTYSISFGLKPKDGYKFAEETTATVNEKPATVTVGGEGNAYRSVKLTFKITPGEPEKVTLSFDPGRGTGEMEPVTVDKYRLFVLPAHDFTGPGDKEFVAWRFVGSDNIAAGDTISIGSNVTATAIWEEEIIRHVDIKGVTKPVAGETPTFDGITVVQDGVEINADNTRWRYFNGNNDTMHNPTDKFAPGVVYTIKISLTPLKDYKFAENITARVNEEDASDIVAVGSDGAYRNIFLKFDKTEGEPEKATVSFDNNGGSGTMESVLADKYSLFTLPECTFTPPTGKLFKAWQVAGVEKAPGQMIDITADTAVKALWVDKATVTFDANGGTGAMSAAEIGKGAKYTLPVNAFTPPTDKVFKAWEVGGEEKSEGEKIEVPGDITIKAVWTEDLLKVSFDANGGTGEMLTAKVGKDSMYKLPSCSFTAPEGKTFKAWKVGEEEISAGNELKVIADTTVKAIWGEKVTVSFSPGEGGTGEMKSLDFLKGTAIFLPGCNFSPPAGKMFKAWKIGTEEKKMHAQITVNEDTLATALWEDDTRITISNVEIKGVTEPVAGAMPTFDGIKTDTPGVKIDFSNTSWFYLIDTTRHYHKPSNAFAQGVAYSIKINVNPLEGYKFAESITATVDGENATEIQTAGTGGYSRHINLDFAKTEGEIEKVKISFEKNGGTGEMAEVEANKYEHFYLPKCEFNAPDEGKAFKAWEIAPGEEKFVGSWFAPENDTVIKALWEDKVTVTFDANGGEGSMPPAEMGKGAKYTLPANKFKAPDGKLFKAWEVAGVEMAEQK